MGRRPGWCEPPSPAARATAVTRAESLRPADWPSRSLGSTPGSLLRAGDGGPRLIDGGSPSQMIGSLPARLTLVGPGPSGRPDRLADSDRPLAPRQPGRGPGDQPRPVLRDRGADRPASSGTDQGLDQAGDRPRRPPEDRPADPGLRDPPRPRPARARQRVWHLARTGQLPLDWLAGAELDGGLCPSVRSRDTPSCPPWPATRS